MNIVNTEAGVLQEKLVHTCIIINKKYDISKPEKKNQKNNSKSVLQILVLKFILKLIKTWHESLQRIVNSVCRL